MVLLRKYFGKHQKDDFNFKCGWIYHKVYKPRKIRKIMPEEKIIKGIKKEESKAMKELKKNPWIVGTFVFAIITLVLLYFVLKGSMGVVSKTTIGENAVDFINTQLLQGQGTVTLDSVDEVAGLYEVSVMFQGQIVPAYFTKDGQYYVGTMIIPVEAGEQTPVQPPAEVPKTDKPKVELFVMSYCPYGTQAEKGIIPAIQALGNKIDSKIRFVHYTMHGETEDTENFRQLCVRETMGQKMFLDYLNCFLEDGNATRCLKKWNLNVDQCINNKAADYYAVDSDLSQQYGVQGSPTLIINGVEADFYPRDPQTALDVICAAFNTPPAECNTQLSTANPDPGFGTTTTAATGNAVADAGAVCA